MAIAITEAASVSFLALRRGFAGDIAAPAPLGSLRGGAAIDLLSGT